MADQEQDGLTMPPGWKFLDLDFGFARTFGPVGFLETADQHLELGFRCGERHLNPLGICHGGATAAFADYAGLGAQYAFGLSRVITPTITLSIDFLQAIHPGQWVSARTDITNLTGKMCFTQTVARVDDTPVMSSRGIFKILSRIDLLEHPFYQRCAELWPSRVGIDRGQSDRRGR